MIAYEEARKGFHTLLRWHLDNGTRPDGHPRKGLRWTNAAFAKAIRQSFSTTCDESAVRHWKTGRHLPDSKLDYIEQVLFGPDPCDQHKVWRDDFSAAYAAAARRSGEYGSQMSSPPLTAATRSDEPEHAIEFISTFEPDDISIEFVFEELIRRSIEIMNTTKFQLPQASDDVTRFRKAVSQTRVNFHWPQDTQNLATSLALCATSLKNYRNPTSLFANYPRDLLHRAYQHITPINDHIQFLLSAYPARLPWVWMSLIDYFGPFSQCRNIFDALRNYIRFANLKIYHASLLTLAPYSDFVPLPPIQHLPFRITSSAWEYNISIFDEETRDEEIVSAYVSHIKGVRLSNEVLVYAPQSLTTRAYAYSISHQPIITSWFSNYLVPQTEIRFAEFAPNEPTSYSEEAQIRKVTTSNGRELDFDPKTYRHINLFRFGDTSS